MGIRLLLLRHASRADEPGFGTVGGARNNHAAAVATASRVAADERAIEQVRPVTDGYPPYLRLSQESAVGRHPFAATPTAPRPLDYRAAGSREA